MEGGRKLEVAEYKPKVKDEKTELQASLAEKSLPAAVSSFSAAQVMQQCRSLVLRSAVGIRKEPPFINRALLPDRVCWPGSVSFPTPATASMMAKSSQPV